MAARMRASDFSDPSNSMDSKSGGEMWLPVTAMRRALNAIRGFRPSSSINAVRSTASIPA